MLSWLWDIDVGPDTYVDSSVNCRYLSPRWTLKSRYSNKCASDVTPSSRSTNALSIFELPYCNMPLSYYTIPTVAFAAMRSLYSFRFSPSSLHVGLCLRSCLLLQHK